MTVPELARSQVGEAGPRPPGRPRGRAQGDPAEGAEDRLEPHGDRAEHHAEPRRQARRVRAGGAAPGRESDRHPARRRARSARRRVADRQDGAARVLRPRGGPHRPVEVRLAPGPAGRRAERLLAARGPAGARQGEGRGRVVPPRQEDEEGDRRPGDDARGAVRDEGGEEAQAHAAFAAGSSSTRSLQAAPPKAKAKAEGEDEAELRRLRRPEEDRRHLLRHRRGRVPRRQHDSDEQDVVPLQVRPGQPERPVRRSPART